LGDEHVRQLTAALAVAGICILTAGCSGGNNQGTTTSTTTSTITSTTTSTTAPPVAEAALDGLLLSPAEVDTAMGATGMTVTATSTSMADDITVAPEAPKDRTACVGVVGIAEAPVYAGSGSTAVRDQLLEGPSDNGALSADQSVVLFPSADQAAAFFADSAQRWSACHQSTQKDSVPTVGPVSNTNGTLSTSLTYQNENAPDSVCERALTVNNNVAIDVSTCGAPSDSAVKIAEQIAAKLPRQ
jgi:hypothetical protein